MSRMLLALEYGNVWFGLLIWATPVPNYTIWWQIFAIMGLLGVFLAFLFTLEVKILKRSNVDGIKFRSGATPGCWCCLFVPLISVSRWSGAEPKSSEAYWQTVLVGLGLLAASVLWVQSLTWRTSRAKSWHAAMKQTFCQVMALALVVGLAMSHLWQIGVVTALVTSIASHNLFSILVFVLPKAFPYSFTLGEAILCAQGSSLFVITAVKDLLVGIRDAEHVDQCTAVTRVVEVVLLCCFLVLSLCLAVRCLRLPLVFYALWLAVAIVVMLPLTASLLKHNPVIWLFEFLLETKIRVCLLLSWVLLTFIAVLVVAYQQFVGSQASTVTRKLFHALILLVYIPGLMWDSELLRLASLLTFAVFLVLECMRVLQMPPLGALLNRSLNVFLDEKDGGLLILTPLYLLIGCSLPIWLDPCRSMATSTQSDISLPRLRDWGMEENAPMATTGTSRDKEEKFETNIQGLFSQRNELGLLKNLGKSLAPWSGILSLGIGDTVASVAGTAFGHHRWPQTKKTVEGTGLAILAQYLVVVLLGAAGWWQVQFPWLRSSLVIIVSSLMEAFTSQVDNLVVPLWTFLMFSSV